ncbi:Enhancer of polycomb-like protein 1 [Tulasnella sp. 427]|nr:Enhancer of polycomb-like protein 1 [Tulasnella sp. 427]
MGRGDFAVTAAASTKGTPRVRNKITHKTRLRIIHGDVQDADRVFVEEDTADGKSLATGVDAEDANEYHLLAVLAASQQQSQQPAASSSTFCTQQPASSSSSSRKAALLAPPPPPAPHIPTPDATGKVENHAELYPDASYKPSIMLAKASDTVEDCMGDALGGGYAYFMDERDADWLEKVNKSAAGGSSDVSGTPRARSAKARGKEPESPNSSSISEDDFELVMGLFERVTEEKFPYLHLTPKQLPLLSDYETFFTSTLPCQYFSSYVVPPSVPQPSILYRHARTIYPWWHERKTERDGRRIIPQLNYDETNDSDPYVCFRRREVKPLRKTRRQDTTSQERMLKLQKELGMVLDMARSVLKREELKRDAAKSMTEVFQKRFALVQIKRKSAWAAQQDDNQLFLDEKPKPPRRPPVEPPAGTIRIRTKARESEIGIQQLPGQDSRLPNPIDTHNRALQKLAALQDRIQAAVASREDKAWEDVTENAYQPLPTPLALKHFQSIPFAESAKESPLWASPSTSTQVDPSSGPIRSGRSAVAMRLRVGRGGRTMVDRRMPAPRHPLNQPLGAPKIKPGESFLSKPSIRSTSPSASNPVTVLGAKTEEEDAEMRDFAWRMEEKWRYDADAGLVIGGAGLPDSIAGDASSEDPRLIVDDYEHNAFVVRKNLLAEEDFSILLRTDDSMRQRAELAYDQRKEVERQFALEAMQRAAVVRREMAARAPPPVPPPTPGTPNAAGATPRTPVAVGASAAAMDPVVAAQLRKMQQVNRVPMAAGQRPHPLATGSALSASTPSQASPPPSSVESGPSPSLSNGLPVLNGTPRIANGIAGPTPPPTQPSFPNQLQPPTVARPSQSPNMSDASAIQTSPTSPLVRPKSQQSLSQVNGTGHVPVPMSLSQQQAVTNYASAFPQANGNLMPSFPNPFNAGLMGTNSAQIRAANGMANGSAVQQQLMLNGLAGMNAAGLSSQQAMGLKNAFTTVNGNQNGMSPPQQLPPHIQAQQQAALQAQLQVNGMAGGLNIGNLNGIGPGPSGMLLNGSLANGNIPLKLPAQRLMQWNAANQKENVGNLMAQQRQQQSSSPIPTSMSPVNGQRLAPGANRGSPHLQASALAGRASPAQMNGIHHHVNGTSSSPHIPHAPSPLASHQQTVQGHMNGF